MSSEALKPDPVTELPLTPPAEEDDEEAAAIWPGVLGQHKAAFPVLEKNNINKNEII